MALLGHRIKQSVKAAPQPKIVTVIRGQLPAALDQMRQLHHGESAD